MNTFVYVLYLKVKYPHDYESDRDAHSIWTDKKTLNAYLKSRQKKYPEIYGPDEIIIEKVRLNTPYTM